MFTIHQIRKRSDAAGSPFFSKATMRHFGQTIADFGVLPEDFYPGTAERITDSDVLSNPDGYVFFYGINGRGSFHYFAHDKETAENRWLFAVNSPKSK